MFFDSLPVVPRNTNGSDDPWRAKLSTAIYRYGFDLSPNLDRLLCQSESTATGSISGHFSRRGVGGAWRLGRVGLHLLIGTRLPVEVRVGSVVGAADTIRAANESRRRGAAPTSKHYLCWQKGIGSGWWSGRRRSAANRAPFGHRRRRASGVRYGYQHSISQQCGPAKRCPVARMWAEPARRQSMFAQDRCLAVWRDRRDVGGHQGVAGAGRLEAAAGRLIS